MNKTLEFRDKVWSVSCDLKMLMQIIHNRVYIISDSDNLSISSDDVFEYLLDGLERCYNALESIVDDDKGVKHEGV